jgi:heptosyltransferase-1
MASTRILLIRTSALGDVIHALPVLTALRRNLPKARIAWLVEDAYVPLLQSHPDLDEVIPVRLRDWRKRPLSPSTWRGIRAFLNQLESYRAEIVLDLMGNHKAGILAALTMSDRRIGLDRRSRREPSSAIWISESIRPSGDHTVDRMLSLLAVLGLPEQPVDFGPEKLLTALGVSTDISNLESPQIVIHPGAGWPNKRYPPDQWGAVARILHQRTGLRTRVISNESDIELARAVERASSGAATEFSAPDLSSLATELSGAALVMGGDTGPIHLAHALGRTVLCLMGPTNPARNGPYKAIENALWHPLPCSFCYKRYQDAQTCMLDLTPEVVAERALNLLRPRSESGCG